MNDPAQKKSPKITNPILVVDRRGELGLRLSKALTKQSIVVFVTKLLPKQETDENIIFVPFNKKFPIIPDNSYSKIFLIDDGETSISSFQAFVKKTEIDRSEMSFITHSALTTNKKIEELRVSKNIQIYILGDVFGDLGKFFPESSVGEFIYQAREKQALIVDGEGLRLSYPVYIDDVLDILVNQTPSNNSKLNFVLPMYPVTDISLAHMFQKTNPHLKIDFKKNTRKQSPYFIKDDANFLLGDKYSIFNRIKILDLYTKTPEDEVTVEEVKRSYLTPFLWIFFFCMFCLSLPFLSTLIYLFLGGRELVLAKDALAIGNISSAQEKVSNSMTFFTMAEKTSKPLSVEARFLGKEREAAVLSYQINLGKDFSNGANDLISSLILFKNVFDGKSKNPEKDFKDGSALLKSSTLFIRKEQAEGAMPKNISDEIQKLSPLIDLVSNTSDFLPDIFGFPIEKKYMILFQNNMELRPGGGFIGSYGILTLNRGTIKDFKISDVYTVDGALKGHVEPPFAIRRYIPVEHWYLRDSNFDLDFEKNAYNAAYFLNLSLGEKVDGVIAIDLSFIKNMLSKIGTVDVSDYNKKVDSDNLFLLTEESSEKNSFGGSSQKKDFLTSLYKSIMNAISINKKISYLGLSEAISKSISEKHLLFGFSDPSLQSISSSSGWSSSLADDRASGSGTLLDFIGINEANLGVNKANYFVSRSVSQSITIGDDGIVKTRLNISFKNNSKSNNWPGGRYKNYLRFVLPEGASVDKILINSKEQEIIPAETNPAVYEKPGFVPKPGLEVERYNQNGKSVLGFLLNTPINSLETITLNYTLPQKLPLLRSSNLYSLKIFKQPGIDSYPFDLSIKLPKSLNYIKGNILIKKEGNMVSKQIDLKKDETLNFWFSPK